MSGTERPIEPHHVIQSVEQYIYAEIADAKKYSNRKPLDESGIYSLHTLAAHIYQSGFNDGRMAQSTINEAEWRRKRDEETQ